MFEGIVLIGNICDICVFVTLHVLIFEYGSSLFLFFIICMCLCTCLPVHNHKPTFMIQLWSHWDRRRPAFDLLLGVWLLWLYWKTFISKCKLHLASQWPCVPFWKQESCIHQWSSECVRRACRICQGAISLGTMTTTPNLSLVFSDLNRLDSPRVQALAADVVLPASDELSPRHGFVQHQL